VLGSSSISIVVESLGFSVSSSFKDTSIISLYISNGL
jgi:hypothetical protein